jgi:hypothetical protein
MKLMRMKNWFVLLRGGVFFAPHSSLAAAQGLCSLLHLLFEQLGNDLVDHLIC